MSGPTNSYGHISIAATMGVSASPDHSSPEDFEIEDASTTHWQGQQPSPNLSQQPQRLSAPLQKRRRVTRACDECRRKKIKCDGKQPCTHCTVYSYECTYDQPSNRRRNPAPQYVENLEVRMRRAEDLLKTVIPQIDLSDPNIDDIIQERRRGGIARDVGQITYSHAPRPGNATNSEEQDSELRSMIESTGQLDLDESGNWDFHGGSSGTVFVKRMREQFRGLLGGGYGQPFLPRLPRTMPLGPMYDQSPRSATESPRDSSLPSAMDFPSKETAKHLASNSLDCACSLLRFVHQPSFYEMLDRLYDLPPEQYGIEEHRFIPLFYVVLALGCMFYVDVPEKEIRPTSYKASINHGLKYFRLARSMMDITDCRDITSLQAVLFMVLFLQSSANLSTCYSYIGVALRSALRMGLHRNLTGNFNPIELETRRRVFWIVRKMDTYVSALLGFPRMLSDDDIDQELPLEIDDEYITKDGILPMPAEVTSLYAASNAHTRLMRILAKCIKYIYPTKGVGQSVKQGSTTTAPYLISHEKIVEIENDLTEWLEKLPMGLKPGGEGTPEVLRAQQLLRLAYAHVQMMLYRPFLHYVKKSFANNKSVHERSYACAAAGVSVSRNIIHITTEMKKRGLLIGAFWFTMYTTFFAILSLVYFVLENPDQPGTQEILADATEGKEALKGLAEQSQAADRCSVALQAMFEQLPERLKNPLPVASNKKRQAPSSKVSMPREAKSNSDLQKDVSPSVGIARAVTFPTPSPAQNPAVSRSSMDDNRFAIKSPSTSSLRQNYQDLRSQAETSIVGTPDSSSTASSIHRQQYNTHNFGTNNALPDVGSMMFPSADPFEYPNQPVTDFGNIKQEDSRNMHNGLPVPPMYLSNNVTGNNMSGLYDDLEGQLFGPLPPYLMQGHEPFDVLGSSMDSSMMGMQNSQGVSYGSNGVSPNGDMNFGGIFSNDGDDWNNMIADQRYR